MKRFLLIAAFVLCCSAAWGRELQVPTEDYNSIQSAIDDANDGDVVVVSAGTYPENIDFLGKAITVRSVNPNDPNVVAATIIDGNQPDDPNQGSVVTFRSGEDNNSTLTGFTITGGTGSWVAVSWEYKGLRWNRCGGGVVCFNMSSPTISKNVFVNNIAGEGGGIYIYGDPVDPNNPSNPAVRVSPVITDNTFINNSAIRDHNFAPPDNNYPHNDNGDGGAIVGFQGCDAVITGNLIENNHAEFYGGGLHLRQWSNGLIEDNQIIGNDSKLGGGIHVTYDSSPTIRYNTIERNVAGTFGGGGMYVYARSNPTIEQNIVTGNDCVNGAGIAVYASSEPLIRNNLIVRNKNGAGIRVRGGAAPQILHNTIANNTAHIYSGGIDCTENAAPIIENNIITSSGDGYGIYADDTSSPVVRYSNIWGNGAGNYGPDISDQTGINGNISAAPGFVGADSNDFHLNYNSSCINAGDPNFSEEDLVDFDGESRKMGQSVDMGADEAWPVWNVSSDANYLAIQDAIDDANDGDTIIVTPGRYYELITFGTKNLVLRSADPNDWDIVEKTIIDANQSGSAVVIAQGQDSNCVFTGFTVTGGDATNGYGGGVYCYASPRIERNIITNNYASYKGGGVYFWSSDVRALLNNNIITHNTASSGAGVLADTSSQPTITNNIISHNHATLYWGGIGCSYNAGVFAISKNQVIGNTAQYGAGIGCSSSSPVISGNLICGNLATIHGGGIRLAFSSPDIINNTIVDCQAPVGGGIYCDFDSDPNIANNIVAFSSQGEGIYCRDDVNWPSEPNVVYNDVYGNNDGNYGGSLTDQTGINGNISIDPNFVSIGYWDDANTPSDANDDFFVPGDYHILPVSVCIDAGDNNSVPADSEDLDGDGNTTEPIPFDIDGNPRFIDGDCNCTYIVDMGAYEFGRIGDFDCDRWVNIVDFAILASAWLTEPGDSQWNPCCDISIPADNYIDWRDLGVFRHNWLEGAQ